VIAIGRFGRPSRRKMTPCPQGSRTARHCPWKHSPPRAAAHGGEECGHRPEGRRGCQRRAVSGDGGRRPGQPRRGARARPGRGPRCSRS
jgi:hypothetical protein